MNPAKSDKLLAWDTQSLHKAFFWLLDQYNPVMAHALGYAATVKLQGCQLTYRFRPEDQFYHDTLAAPYNRAYMDKLCRRLEPAAYVRVALLGAAYAPDDLDDPALYTDKGEQEVRL